ncbi:hypothetical protein H6F75_17115 [Nodosilinea sp. FACHB-131]|uniref:hypothetical protein n=1 Tax=Cyanophyceae TaxID=3028117 RepID=UPI0016847168|nr:hypothetical protein [Nodosilinea sp. FACHB-131]MBD1875205.1 hypothetical protein [Nodosilinea sp. FACHB-131]
MANMIAAACCDRYSSGSITACQSLSVELDSSLGTGLPLMKIVGVDQTPRLIA